MSRHVPGALVALVIAVVTVAGSPSIAEDGQRELVAGYLTALASRAVGEIEARAYVEARRPDGPPTPTAGVTVRAVPYAAGFDARLEAIKRQQRDSMATYTGAHADVTAARERYEGELGAAGAGELI